MQIVVDARGAVVVVRVDGSIDGLTGPELQTVLDAQLADGHHRLVADFERVDYTSSAGLRVLLGTVKGTRAAGGDLRLAAVQDGVRRVLEMAGFLGILKTYPDVDAAVASFTG